MRILAIDLGETTGYCVLNGSAIHSFGAIPLEAVVAEVPTYLIDLVVIERPAYREHPAQQERYEVTIHKLRVLFGDKKVKIVRPADWMPRFSHHPLPERGVLKTQHEKDAYRLAHYAAEKFA